MAYVTKQNTKVFIKKESTENIYAAPTTGTDALQVIDIENKPSREMLERNVLGQGIGKIAPRVGGKSISGSLSLFMKAASTPTSVSESEVLLESLLGSKRSSTSITSGSSHTTSVINVSSTTNLHVGDTVILKVAGAYHASPIASLIANTSITLAIPAASAPANGTVIEAFTTFVPTNSGHPSFSVSTYYEDAILEKAIGCKTSNLSVDGFESEKQASFKFGFEGLNFDRLLSAPAYSPSFSTSDTPLIVDACIILDGVEQNISKFTLSIENKIGMLTNTCDGKFASRITERLIKGSINPYMDTASVDFFTKFNTNTSFSLFISAHNPTATTGEFKESVSFYLPNCKFTELALADSNGNLQEALSFSVNTINGEPEIYISLS